MNRAMIKVHHAKRARSARVIWLLEELGEPYERVIFDFKPENLRSPEYLKLHPLGEVPVVEDGDVTIFESGAILQYLLEKYGKGRLEPRVGTPERALYLQWFHFGEASLAQLVSTIVRHRFNKPEAERIPVIVTEARERLRPVMAVVERALEGREFIVGSDFTAADIMIAYGLVMARITKELPADLPNIAGYLDRLKERPSYGRAWA
jgi:glutathione S-transferase